MEPATLAYQPDGLAWAVLSGCGWEPDTDNAPADLAAPDREGIPER